jgi:hypothetical protein
VVPGQADLCPINLYRRGINRAQVGSRAASPRQYRPTARYLACEGNPERLVALVAHYSAAACEAEERGLPVGASSTTNGLVVGLMLSR